MTVRLTTFISQKNSGWSENFYSNSTVTNGLNEVLTNAGLRRALLPTGATIIGVRASAVDPPGLSLVSSLSLAGSSGIVADNSYQSLLLSITNGFEVRRSFLLRGLPDARNAEGVYVPSAAYDLALSNWKNNLISQQFQLRQINRANPLVPIATVSGTGLLTVVGAQTWLPGQKFKFYRQRTVNGLLLPKPFVIAAVTSSTTFQLAAWPTGETVLGGYGRLYAISYSDIAEVRNTNRTLSRKVGRPFGQPVGRRKVRN